MSGHQTNQEKILLLRDFSFEVPEAQIAQVPAPRRDDSRLLVWDQRAIVHGSTRNLSQFIPEGSLFIVNNSRVIASRIHGKLPSGGVVELLLLEADASSSTANETWQCLGKPMRKLAKGTKVFFEAGLTATIAEEPLTSGDGPQPFRVEFSLLGEDLLRWLDLHGEMPLPPYITRKDSSEDIRIQDKERYQTVYAEGRGSVAAPTAGLHFTEEIMAGLKKKGCEFAHVTLHVGAGTFLPVKSDDPAQHVMHSERFFVPRETVTAIRKAMSEKRKIIVVGTTALRSLEGMMAQASQENITIEELAGRWLRTSIFIRPKSSMDRYKPWCASAIMTNFHQPESTLFMLICALIGFDSAHRIYREAIASGYRFYSYGDSSLLWF